MKRKLLWLALGIALAGPAWAQLTNSTNAPPASPPPTGGPHPMQFHGFSLSEILTPAEEEEFHAARAAALQANPDLAAQETKIMGQIKAARASGRQPDPALIAQLKDLLQKSREAMLKADPKLAPVLAKIDAAIKQNDRRAEPPPPPKPPPTPLKPPPTNSAPSGN